VRAVVAGAPGTGTSGGREFAGSAALSVGWGVFASMGPAAFAGGAVLRGRGLVVGDWGTLLREVLLGPWGEEFAFRGFFLNAALRAWGPVPSVLVSALLFYLPHLGGGLHLGSLAGGILYGSLYLGTGSLWCPILAHVLHNAGLLLASQLVGVREGHALVVPLEGFVFAAALTVVASAWAAWRLLKAPVGP